MKEMLSSGKRSWYASPLKALSNSKYQEFSDELGAENVGILTGDRKENTDARIIVGTTEILRNHLYDSMNTGEDFPAQSAFVADDFQVEAIEKIRATDVIVSAPTGSGKTWIAVQAMKEMLSSGKTLLVRLPAQSSFQFKIPGIQRRIRRGPCGDTDR